MPPTEAPAATRHEKYSSFGEAAPEVILAQLFLQALQGEDGSVAPEDLVTFELRSGVLLEDRMGRKAVPGFELYLRDRIDFVSEERLRGCLDRGTLEVWIHGSLQRLRSKLWDRSRELTYSYLQLQEEVYGFLVKLLEEGCPEDLPPIQLTLLAAMRKLFPPKPGRKDWTPETATAGQLRVAVKHLRNVLLERLKSPRSEEVTKGCRKR